MKRKRKSQRLCVADFETNTTAPTYVWGYGKVEIGKEHIVEYGSSIDEFLEKCQDGDIIYFHNLAFDGAFILDFLMRNGFEAVKTIQGETIKENTIQTVITADRNYYLIKFKWDGKTIELRDSLKKLPYSVKQIGQDFLSETDEKKTSIDYDTIRTPGAELSEEDKEYIKNDVVIVSKALAISFSQGYTRLTVGADGLAALKTSLNKKYRTYFPEITLEMDDEIRESYKGGFTYLLPKYQGVDIHTKGTVIDVNSLYPSVMVYENFPVGEPILFSGKYQPDKFHPLYIQYLQLCAILKPDHIPVISLKNNRFMPAEYLVDTQGFIDITVTSVDWELIQEHYNIIEAHFISGYKFASAAGVFDNFILPLYEARTRTKGAEKQLIKLILNSVYGKLAKNPRPKMLLPRLEETLKLGDAYIEESEAAYLPAATFITSYARRKTITTAQRMYDQFIYSDTDSVHMIGSPPPWVDIDSSRLGAWKIENEFTRARFLRSKRYIEIDDATGQTVVKCAGMSERAKKDENGKLKVTWDNFQTGTIFHGNFKKKTVEGGVILVESPFQLT